MRLIDADQLYEQFNDNDRVVGKRAVRDAINHSQTIIPNNNVLHDGQIIVEEKTLALLKERLMKKSEKIERLERIIDAISTVFLFEHEKEAKK